MYESCKKWSISKSISSANKHAIKKLTVNCDTPRQYLNFVQIFDTRYLTSFGITIKLLSFWNLQMMISLNVGLFVAWREPTKRHAWHIIVHKAKIKTWVCYEEEEEEEEEELCQSEITRTCCSLTVLSESVTNIRSSSSDGREPALTSDDNKSMTQQHSLLRYKSTRQDRLIIFRFETVLCTVFRTSQYH